MSSGLILPAGIEASRPNRHARRAAGVNPGLRFGNKQPRPGPVMPPAQIEIGRNDETVMITVAFGDRRFPFPLTPAQGVRLARAMYQASIDLDPDLAEEEEQPEAGDGRPALQEFCQALPPDDNATDPGPARAG